MKENLFSDLPITDQATLTLITFIDVVKENGVPPLPHAWEFPNVRGYAQERKEYPAPYLDLFFHRNSGGPFIRDNAKLFSLHVDYFDHLNPSSFDTFDLSFNYYKRNKVVDAWYLDRNTEIDYNSLHSFIDKNFSRDLQYNIVQGLGEVLKVIYKYGGVLPRKLHLTGVQYKLLRKKTPVEKLVVDTTLFITTVRKLNYVEYNENLVIPVFEHAKEIDSDVFTKSQFLTTPTNGYYSVMMEIGSIYNTKHFKLNTDTLRYLLEKESVFDAPIELDYLVDLFNRFMSFLISQDYYVTPNKIYSQEETYLLHEVGELTGGIRAILNYFDLNYVNYYVNSNILSDVYCYFY